MLSRRILASCRRLYGRVIMYGVFVTLLLCLLYKINQTTSITGGHEELSSGSALKRDDTTRAGRGFAEPLIARDPEKRRYESEIEKDLAMQRPGLGDNGKPAHLTGIEMERGKLDLAKIAMNEELSKHLSYNRTTPDGRNPHCKTLRYDTSTLPSAAVIIIFYDEAFSVVVRTVHSVLNTASENLKEVILVDDASTHEELHGKLEHYVATRFPKMVRLIRMESRSGLIRARLAGARATKQDVIIFLDAHCECMQTWLEPMLERIKESRTSVVVPIIDVIDAEDFHYSTNGYDAFQVGGFTWNGHFDWIDVPKRERRRQKAECKRPAEICPTYSPTMAGGLLAIDRKYFWEVGSYDEEMDGWGGENLEMSFRVWQCGGTIETIPCSRIGHVFREFHPYKFPKNKDTHGINTVRLAKVWMDEYQSIYLSTRPDLEKNVVLIGDISKRVALRERLQCKNFKWYLRNVYPQKFVPTDNVQGYGRVQNQAKHLCLDDLQQNRDEPFKVGVYWCHDHVQSSQFFSLTNEGLLRVEEGCMAPEDADEEDEENSTRIRVMLRPCKSGNEDKWELTESKQLRFLARDKCLDVKGLKSSDHAYVTECDASRVSQKWEIVH